MSAEILIGSMIGALRAYPEERFVCMSFVIHIHACNVGLNLEGRRYGGVSSYRSNTTLSNHSNTIPQSGRSGDEVVIHFGSGFTEQGLKM